MQIAIIGAGITGLTAAYRLTREGHSVTIYEAGDTPGGLGTYLEIGGNHLERYYHHFFQSDRFLIELVHELDLQDRLHFHPSKTSLFYDKTLYPFSGPMDLLRFAPLPLVDRIRCGVVLAYLKYAPVSNLRLDSIAAAPWLKRWSGKASYKVIWEPLLMGKFAQWADTVPLAWLKDRIRDRSFKLGYIEGSAKTLFDALIRKIEMRKGTLFLKTPVTAVEEKDDKVYVTTAGRKKPVAYDACIVTTVSPIALQLVKNKLTTPYESPNMLQLKLNTDVDAIEKEDGKSNTTVHDILSQQDQLGAVCVILELDRQVQPHYWINVNDRKQPVLVAIEHTNLIPASEYGNTHIMYLANYIHRDEKGFKKSDAATIKEYAAFLKSINPDAKPSWIKKSHVSRAPRTQTIFKTGALHTRPPKQLTEHIYLGNIDQMYPHDRNLNLGVELGGELAQMIIDTEASS